MTEKITQRFKFWQGRWYETSTKCLEDRDCANHAAINILINAKWSMVITDEAAFCWYLKIKQSFLTYVTVFNMSHTEKSFSAVKLAFSHCKENLGKQCSWSTGTFPGGQQHALSSSFFYDFPPNSAFSVFWEHTPYKYFKTLGTQMYPNMAP